MADKEHKGAAQKSAMFDQQPASEEMAGNVKRKGQDPSPDDRSRGETSDKDKTAATSL